MLYGGLYLIIRGPLPGSTSRRATRDLEFVARILPEPSGFKGLGIFRSIGAPYASGYLAQDVSFTLDQLAAIHRSDPNGTINASGLVAHQTSGLRLA